MSTNKTTVKKTTQENVENSENKIIPKIPSPDEGKKNIFDSLNDEILNSDLPEAEKNKRLSILLRASSKKVNLLLVGATGAGKSSTINALFDMSVAKVGVGVDPETQDIQKFDLNNLVIWDTPGLGDTIEKDKKHIKQIVRKLSETDSNGDMLIDLVLVVLDAGSKDMAVSYDVINNTLIPCLGKETNRILIALNQADLAMKGRHWDNEKNAPDEVLVNFLKQKVDSVKRRVMEATKVAVEPIYYAAGYTSEDGEHQTPYNLSKLLYYILRAVPSEKRLALVDKLNDDDDNWICNDDDKDYVGEVKKTFWDSLLVDIESGADKGAEIGGMILGVPGVIVGGLIGGILGGLKSLITKPFSW